MRKNEYLGHFRVTCSIHLFEIALNFRIKGSPDPSHFIFEINLGKSRIRHTITLKWKDEFLDRPKID